MDCRIYPIILSIVPKITAAEIDRLVEFCGDIPSIFSERREVLYKLDGVRKATVDFMHSKDITSKAEEELKRMDYYGIQYVFYLDDTFPFKLLQIPDAPLILFYKGNLPKLSSHTVSIIGTRKATNYGVHWVDRFVKSLSLAYDNIEIVSGLAYGIDQRAHQCSVSFDIPTFGILGHGLHTIYPASNASLAAKIIDSGGGIISEFPTFHSIRPQNFIQRNRIIAGLSDAVVVVESKVKGGAIHTANMAFSYSREVFALPGSYLHDTSEGCHQLIKRQVASLIDSADDIERVMDWPKSREVESISQNIFEATLDSFAKKVLQMIQDQDKISIDEMGTKLNIPIAKLSPILTQLEFMNLIEVLPGKYYRSI
ncbi:DNA-processing protein DprA [Halosquirtibacter laminarini]|uniref:DNA-processing protein DprA n=1 Tax=Halosquirtibacter laminarini TaxID=3374600 RepID=A0AC61ND23_9BACT|nr:DNA-processing protein DprA [Prolixibacteraceae bacterium]